MFCFTVAAWTVLGLTALFVADLVLGKVDDLTRSLISWFWVLIMLPVAVYVGYRIRNWKWPHILAIFAGPALAVAFHWIAEDLASQERRSPNLFGAMFVG